MAKKDVEQGKLLAGLMYLVNILGLVGFVVSIVIWAVKRENKYLNYHFKQLLVLVICSVIVSIIGVITMFILIGFLILVVGGIFFFVLWIIGMVNAFSGKQQPLPVIGQWGEKWFKF